MTGTDFFAEWRLGEFMNGRRRYFDIWKIAACCLVLSLCVRARAEEDTLANLWTGQAEDVRQQILRTADLPGGEAVRPLANGPVLLWVERSFLGTDNAYSSEETRYAVLRVIVANLGQEELQLKKEKITLRAGTETFKIGGRTGLLRDIPLEIDWHIDGNVRPQSQLRTPRTIKIASGKSAAFWCIFAGFDPVPPIPVMSLVVEPETGARLELDLNAQQNARLGLTSQQIGPSRALTVLTVHGQLNRINSVRLAQEISAAVDQGASRFVVEWSPQAQPSDDVLFNWLMASSMTVGQSNPLQLQLPALPATRQLLLSELPKGNEEVDAWDGAEESIVESTREAVVFALRDIFERVEPSVVLSEILSGHPWSKAAALEVAGSRLQADALPVLLELSKDEHPNEQRAAILALGTQRSPLAESRLNELALSREENVAKAAFSALLATSTPTHRQEVKKLLAEHRLALSGEAIFKLLAANYHPDWDSFLSQGVHDEDPKVRRVALEVLNQIGHPQLNLFCKNALADNDEDVREQAFQILVAHPDRDAEQAARDYALKRLSDGHVDESILEFIELVRETKAAPALLAEIQKPDRPRARLIEVIGEIGTNEHVQAVLNGLEKYTEDERVAALELVNRLSVPMQLKIARQVSGSNYVAVRYAALEILKSIGNEDALAILAEMLKSPNSKDDAEVICVALGEIGTEGAVRRLRECQERAAVANDVQTLRAVEQALRIWKSRLPGFNFIEAGYLHNSSDEFDEALKAFSMAILINPDLADAYSARGNIYLRQNEFKKAREDFHAGMRLDPYDSQAITGVAIVSAIDGNCDAAVKLVDDNMKRFSGDQNFSYNTACVYSRCVETLKKLDASPERDQQIADFQKRAIQKLKEAFKQGFGGARNIDWMQKDPDLAAIRDLPEFKKLLPDE